MGGVRSYFESTPPPGTWFAAQASHRDGSELASTRVVGKPTPASTDSDDNDGDTSSDSTPGRTVVNARDLHRVGPGESLRSIAHQYGVSISSLKNANQISTNSVRAGTMLAIPSS
jgi:N-acetylmuramoyl-L-alanine amidase